MMRYGYMMRYDYVEMFGSNVYDLGLNLFGRMSNRIPDLTYPRTYALTDAEGKVHTGNNYREVMRKVSTTDFQGFIRKKSGGRGPGGRW